MPQSFGRFDDNFTLHGVVCDDCNQYFGDHLELYLGRDTLEGQTRFRHGVKTLEDFKPMGRSGRIVVRCAEGPLKGCYMQRYYSAEKENMSVKPMPQVGFKLRGRENYKYFLLDDIPTQAEIDAMGFDAKHSHPIIGLVVDPADLKSHLADKGIVFNHRGPWPQGVPPEIIECELEGTIDHVIFRAIAKIGFNYLAFGEGGEFVQHPAFDSARRYIRFGDVPDYTMVQSVDEAILSDEPIEGRRILGHLITVNWASDGVSVLAQVALFNRMTYRVVLAVGISGPPPALTRGHLFDIHSRKILELGARPTARS